MDKYILKIEVSNITYNVTYFNNVEFLILETTTFQNV
jgi:hypothetical protein